MFPKKKTFSFLEFIIKWTHDQVREIVFFCPNLSARLGQLIAVWHKKWAE